jgi:DNA-binding GntR family transcriptional regulator
VTQSPPSHDLPEAADGNGVALPAISAHYRTKQEIVAERLRNAILTERYAPGEWLRLRDLATMLGTSTMPIREALQLLASEGLVVLSPHRGAQVSPLTADELEELYMARLGLEGLAARLGAAEIGSADLGRMHDLLREMDAAIEAHDSERFLRLDLEFHTILYRSCGRPSLVQRMDNLYKLCYRYMRRARVLFADTEYTTHFHQDLIEAFERRDSARAEQIVRQDLDFTVSYMRQYMAEHRAAEAGDNAFAFSAGHLQEG